MEMTRESHWQKRKSLHSEGKLHKDLFEQLACFEGRRKKQDHLCFARKPCFKQPGETHTSLEVASPFFSGILLSRKPPKTLGKWIWFLKRTMAEKNGKGINPWNGPLVLCKDTFFKHRKKKHIETHTHTHSVVFCSPAKSSTFSGLTRKTH